MACFVSAFALAGALAACSSASSPSSSRDALADSGTAGTDTSPSADADLDAGFSADAFAADAFAPDAPAPDASPPVPPADLVEYLTGDPADLEATPLGGLLIMGGSTDVDDAFRWQRDRIAGGDIVILRTSGADGYNEYLYRDIGGTDSVHTMLVTTRAQADSDYVAAQLAGAEAIFLAGGDQSTYVDTWNNTAIERELLAAYHRGAILGGTSAGAAVLGRFVFGAHGGSVTSSEVLADPFDPLVTIDRNFLDLPLLADVITDTHFRERDRMGRLAGFIARILTSRWTARAIGIGVGEETALVVDENGLGQVLGTGDIYVLYGERPPETCVRGQPLTYQNISYVHLTAGDTLQLPGGAPGAGVTSRTMSITAGMLDPADPY